MVTKLLHKQQRGKVYTAVLWAAILAFLAYIGVQIYWNGMGEASGGRGFGLKGKVSAVLRDLEGQGHGELAKWIMIAVLAAAGIYALLQIIVCLRSIGAKNTSLGQSICRQAAPGETFEELCRKIDMDMESGHKEFSGIVFVSSSWILEDDIMRVSRIQSISDKVSTGEKTVELKDIDGNCMTLSFLMKEWAQELLDYLKKTFPAIPVVGGTGQREEPAGKSYSWHVPKTENEVRTYADRAAAGDAHAQTEYGKCLLFGKGGSAADGASALAWFQKAAEQSDEIAKMYVGHCLLYGIGTDRDEAEGYRMLNAALEYNYPEDSSSQPQAEYSSFENEDLVQLFWDLGDAFENSLGVERNYQVAVYYFSMMDDWGHPEGAERMRSYKKGALGWKKI